MSLIRLKKETLLRMNSEKELLIELKKMMEDSNYYNRDVIRYARALSFNYESIDKAKEVLLKMSCRSSTLATLELAKIELSLGKYNCSRDLLNSIRTKDKSIQYQVNNIALKNKIALKEVISDKLLKNSSLILVGDYFQSICDFKTSMSYYELHKESKPLDLVSYTRILPLLYKMYDYDKAKSEINKIKKSTNISFMAYFQNAFTDDLFKEGYTYMQEHDYSEENLLKHLRGHVDGNSTSLFKENLDLSVFHEYLKGNLNDNNFLKSTFADKYIIEFPGIIGTVCGIETNKVEVVSIVNSDKVLTFYPVLSSFNQPHNEKERLYKIKDLIR